MDHTENNELSKLSHAVTRLETQVTYLEKDVDENRKANDVRFSKLEQKIDTLQLSFAELRGDIKAIIVRLTIIGGGAVFAIQMIGKHFGWFG
jgi:peptidoglycan hydrolase CwlO-like protein